MNIIQKILLSALILFVLGGDLIGIISEYAILKAPPEFTYQETNDTSSLSTQLGGLPIFKLSLPKLLFYSFYAGGVFNTVAVNNIDYAIYGQPKDAPEGQPWVDLGYLQQCFPYPLGETYIRLDMQWHKLLGDVVYKKSMRDLLAKIREKYNREHPDKPMQKTALYVMWWPRSEQSYTALRYPQNVKWQLVDAEGR